MIEANNPELKSWIDVRKGSDFPIQNLPFGMIRPQNGDPRPATRIGDTAIDLSVLADFGYFDHLEIDDLSVFYQPVLNPLMALGKPMWSGIRKSLSELFSLNNTDLQQDEEARNLALIPINQVKMEMPVAVGDYTDFYSSIEHATNVGVMFRDPANALFPNWKHLPVGYHGRSSSIVVSGTNIYRPKGQTMINESSSPVFGPSKLVDFELEMAFITGKESKLGESIPIEQTEDYIFGMVLFNDLSARDIQKWEYVPLGPFLAKSFGSVISPWIVTMEALQPFRVEGPKQDPPVLPYLKSDGKDNYDIQLEVSLTPDNGAETTISRSNYKYLYWSVKQQLAHQTVNGCNIRVGDMYGSGTISGPTTDTFGSMLELSWQGTKPISLNEGGDRKFIQDHDTITMRGHCQNDRVRIGFGECITKILPAN
ncbi:MAG: fumarylacetoacetase [Bacteroidetes bacterium GWF2_41_31]|nr:MAG: fumarylacetoacetase [Bacteroidetes bacterium GWF2_41_31]